MYIIMIITYATISLKTQKQCWNNSKVYLFLSFHWVSTMNVIIYAHAFGDNFLNLASDYRLHQLGCHVSREVWVRREPLPLCFAFAEKFATNSCTKNESHVVFAVDLSKAPEVRVVNFQLSVFHRFHGARPASLF